MKSTAPRPKKVDDLDSSAPVYPLQTRLFISHVEIEEVNNQPPGINL